MFLEYVKFSHGIMVITYESYLVDVCQTRGRVPERPGGVVLRVVVERLVHRDDGRVQRSLVHRHLARKDPADLDGKAGMFKLNLFPL